MKCYILSEWVQTEGPEGPENVPRLFLEYGRFVSPPLQLTDITDQACQEIEHGHLGVFTVHENTKRGPIYADAPQKLLDALEADPLYKVIPIEGKPSKRELDDLKASEKLKGHIQGAETRHGANMTNEHLKDALCESFRKQGRKKVEV